MKLQKTLVVALMLCAFMLSGCTMALTGRAKVQEDSFGKQKKYAVVTIAAGKFFNGEQGFFQLFKKNENIEGLDTQPVLDQLMPVVREKFSKTGYFTSLPMKTILGSQAYRELEEDERTRRVAFFKGDVNVARGYKYFSDPQKLGRLARELKVDGVVTVVMDFSVMTMKSAFYVPVGTFGKKAYAAEANIAVVAYDAEGQVLWKDSTMKQAEPGDKKAIVVLDITDFANTDYVKMHPSAVLIGRHAVDVVVQRFQDTMEGRKTSIFQRVRTKETKQATKEG